MTRTQVKKSTEKRAEPQVDETPESRESPSKEITDELLDEIDGLLESNAEEFVAAFRQKGGE